MFDSPKSSKKKDKKPPKGVRVRTTRSNSISGPSPTSSPTTAHPPSIFDRRRSLPMVDPMFVRQRASAAMSHPTDASREELIDIIQALLASQSGDASDRRPTTPERSRGRNSTSNSPARMRPSSGSRRGSTLSMSDAHIFSSTADSVSSAMSTPQTSTTSSARRSLTISISNGSSRRASVTSSGTDDDIIPLEIEPLPTESHELRRTYDRRCSFEDFEVDEKMSSAGRRMATMLNETRTPRRERAAENGLLTPTLLRPPPRRFTRETSLHDIFVAKLTHGGDQVVTPRRPRQEPHERIDPNVDNDSGWVPLSPSTYFDESRLEIVLNNLPVFVRPNYRSGDFDGSYADNLCCSSHCNFAIMPHVPSRAPIIVSARLVASFGLKPSLMVLVRHTQGDERIRLPWEELKHNSKIAMSDLLATLAEHESLKSIMRRYELSRVVPLDAAARRKLRAYEKDDYVSQFKFGVVLVKSGQRTDDEYLSNDMSAGSADFEDFLLWMGDKIGLQGWTLFAGGLDTSARRLHGVDSLYTTVSGREIHFHVGPMIPNGTDAQSVERKRHIGNDIVVIVFIDDEEETYDPASLASNFTHVVAAVRVGKRDEAGRVTHYSISLVHSTAFKPLEPMPAWVALDTDPSTHLMPRTPATRLFFLSTLMNLEISSYHGSKFRPLLASTKKHNLSQIVENHAVTGRGKHLPPDVLPTWLRI